MSSNDILLAQGFFSDTKTKSNDWWYKDPETQFDLPFDQSDPGSYVFRLVVQMTQMTEAGVRPTIQPNEMCKRGD